MTALLVLAFVLAQNPQPFEVPAAIVPDFSGTWQVDQVKTGQVRGTTYDVKHPVYIFYRITQTPSAITLEIKETGFVGGTQVGRVTTRTVLRLDGQPSKNQPGLDVSNPLLARTYVTTWEDGKLISDIDWNDELGGHHSATDVWSREGQWLVRSYAEMMKNGKLAKLTVYWKKT